MNIPTETIVKNKLALVKDHINKNQLNNAENILNDLLEEDSVSIESLIWLALIKKKQGDLKSALMLANKANNINPNNSDILNLVGLYSNDIGDTDSALDYFKKSQKIKENATAILAISSIYWGLDKKILAISYLEKNISKIKDYRIPMKLSAMQFEEKLYSKSIENACRLILAVDDNQIINNLKTPFADSLFYLDKDTFPFPDNNNVIISSIEKLLDDGSEYRNLKNGFFKFIFKDIKADFFKDKKEKIFDEEFISEYIKSNFDILNDDYFIKYLSSDLLLKRLKNSLICCHHIENIYTQTRKHLLSKIFIDKSSIGEAEHKLLSALCIQCDYNGYIWEVTDKEKKEIQNVEEKIIEDLKLTDDININEVLIYACYKPLLNNTSIVNYLSKKFKDTDEINYEVIQSLILEPLSLRENNDHIKSFNKVKDKTSLKVMNMYKEHPYPKWKGIYYIPSEINVHQKYYDRDLTEKNDSNIQKEILIAGCGTGQELVTVSKIYSNSNITAIDISLPSLSYAYKRAKDNDVNNFELIHMDLLELVNYKKKFDIINCSGVLHHMKDPELGLKALISCLKEDGYLNIGLYSRTARENITKLRKLIADNNLNNSHEEITKIRRSIILGYDGYESFNHLLNVRDFYSFNEMQDLLFHPRELVFNLEEIDEMLRRNNLAFIEFDNKYQKVKDVYNKNYPKDKKLRSVKNWIEFEDKYPLTFLGMYQFFAKRVDE
ncbi:MAG: hypothetical protein CMP62_05885 [Flavobacteriales bacterium]|nr:hypothetical protein [Flavobacteriales bacterium]